MSGAPARASRGRRATAVVVLVLAAAASVWWRPWAGRAADDDPGPRTVPVERTTLASTMRLSAQLGYGEAHDLVSAAGGIVTALPSAGDVVEPGQVLFEADGRPVIFLPGARPLWRAIGPGDVGPDVAQLRAALRGLGLDVGPGPEDAYDEHLATAVDALYSRIGHVPPGAAPAAAAVRQEAEAALAAAETALTAARAARGEAARGPSAAELAQAEADVAAAQRQVRAAEAALAAASAAPAPAPSPTAGPDDSPEDLADVLAAARDAERVARARLDALRAPADTAVQDAAVAAAREELAAARDALDRAARGTVGPGDLLVVDAPSVRVAGVVATLGAAAAGTVLTYTDTRVEAYAELTDAQARELVVGTPVTLLLPSGDRVDGLITSVEAGGEPTDTPGQATAPAAVIEAVDPDALTGIGLPAVTVEPAGEQVADALVVPVTALVALVTGGYAVDVLDGGRLVRVPVELGLLADTRVQIVGGDLAEGDLVVVPS